MNKDIVLPSQRFVVSRKSVGAVGGHIMRVNTTDCMNVHKDDLLPMARALIEINEGIEAERESEFRKRQAREAGEPVKGT